MIIRNGLLPFAVLIGLFPGCGSSTDRSKTEAPPIVVNASSETGKYAGSKTCRDCHEKFYELWSTSHHGLAMQPYTADFAKKQLTPQINDVSIGKRAYRAEFNDGRGTIRERSPQGEKTYPIVQVMGGKNVYYFLLPLERGRLQVAPVAYDVGSKSWYDTAASGVRHFPDRRDEVLDWTDRMFTFNTTCFNCHVSGLATNYDLASDTYQTTWAEPGISCESCHGPGAEHNRVMQADAKNQAAADMKIIRAKDLSSRQINDLCDSCHAKSIPLSRTFNPGDNFFDNYDLLTLEHPDYYPDGRDLGENYTFTSWLMSPCAGASNLNCNHCHTPSGRMRYEGPASNRACESCHADKVAATAEHSRHPAGDPSSNCIACHMPTTSFAGMRRTDHSMRPPTPATTIAFKSPNACNICHTDKDAAWSDQCVRQWHEDDYQSEPLRRAELIDRARKRQWTRLPEMLAELKKPGNNQVYKTSLVRLLNRCDDDGKWPVLLELSRDRSPLVRSSAVSELASRTTPQARQALLAAAADESRLVRVRAAMALAAIRPNQLQDQRERMSLEKATADFMQAMKARPDDWASYGNLGNFYMGRRDFTAAIACFDTAIKLEPRMVGPMINAAIAGSNLNQPDKAEQYLQRALKYEPDNAEAHFNLALLLGERGRVADAEAELRTALKTDPQIAPAAYNLGVILAEKNLDEAILWCRKAHELRPGESKYSYTLAFYLYKKRDAPGAIDILQTTLQLDPAYLDAYPLLADIFEQREEPQKAAGVYRVLLKQDGLAPAIRQQLQAKIESLESAGK